MYEPHKAPLSGIYYAILFDGWYADRHDRGNIQTKMEPWLPWYHIPRRRCKCKKQSYGINQAYKIRKNHILDPRFCERDNERGQKYAAENERIHRNEG